MDYATGAVALKIIRLLSLCCQKVDCLLEFVKTVKV